MIISFKDLTKLFGISIIACCAVFVCTLFLNYNIDLLGIDSTLLSEAGKAMYNAHLSMGKIIIAVTGGCLALTSIIMLIFYIKNYIDNHNKELGIMKANGYSNLFVAKNFWIFGLTVFVGCAIGFIAAFLYLPQFYNVQNAEHLFPNMSVKFHFILPLCLIIIPTIVFSFLSVSYAYFKLKRPALDLIYDRKEAKVKKIKPSKKNLSFLQELKKTTLKSRKTLIFFVAFSAFCFSAMVQMSISMINLSSATFAWMILSIGLILSFMTILMSLSSVVKGNAKTIAMMRVMGYNNETCSKNILGVYRPYSYIGFIIGTLYQFGLLKMMTSFVFSNIENMPNYNFDWKALLITIIAFIIIYETIMFLYSLKIKKSSIKTIMLE